MRRLPGTIALVLCAIAFPGVLLCAQTERPYQAAVDEYRTALAALEAHQKAQRVEPAFTALAEVRHQLTQRRPDGRTLIESLPAGDFERLQRDLSGVLLSREETIVVEPDPDFFVQLSVGHGDAADRQFFAALKTTHPETEWPVYVQQQTGAGGCIRFGSGTLVGTYRVWSAFRRRFPERYVSAAAREVGEIERTLTTSTCACGDRSSVAHEMERFVGAFPRSPIRAAVRARLQAVRSGQSDMRENCVAG